MKAETHHDRHRIKEITFGKAHSDTTLVIDLH